MLLCADMQESKFFRLCGNHLAGEFICRTWRSGEERLCCHSIVILRADGYNSITILP